MEILGFLLLGFVGMPLIGKIFGLGKPPIPFWAMALFFVGCFLLGAM